MSCPDANTLLDFAGGRLGKNASEVVELHLDSCALCRDLVADLFSGSARGHPPPVSLRPGDRVGRFVVRECLGRGGMGVVYAAIDPELDRIVAIKLLHRSREIGAEDRLVREARAIARLAHPNVVTVFGMGMLDRDHGESVVFVAMERLVGATMRQWLAGRERTLDEILAVFRGAGAGLAAAHANGLVHRDFKPDNVMIDGDGVAKVMDFGLARLGVVRSEEASLVTDVDSDDRLTGTGTLMGTPAYMAPEQHENGIVDARSDQYAFCAALFEAVCGERPFRQRDHADLRAAKRAAAFSFPAQARVPGWLRRVVTRGLSPDAAHRFATMDELADRLRPPRRGVLVATMLALGTVSVALGLRWSPAVAEGCDTAGSAAALGWDPARRDAVASSLRDGLAEDATRAALRGIDGWVDRWVGAHALACAAADDGQLACLASRRAAFATVVDLLAEAAPGAGARPAAVVEDLGDPIDCRAEPGVDDDGSSAPELAEIRTLRDLGRGEEARREAETAILAARARGDDRGLARLLLELAATHENLDDWPAALAAVEESYHLAEVVGDRHTAARAAIRSLSVLSNSTRDRREMQRWLRHAEAAVERAEPSDDLAIGLAVARARVAVVDGDLLAARAHLEWAVARAERSGSGWLHVSLSNLGAVLAESEEITASISVFERDRETLVRTYGADHPLVAHVDSNLGASLAEIGEYDRALATLELAENTERSLPAPRPTRLGRIESNRGTVYLRTGRSSAAETEFRRAADHFAQGHPIGHPATSKALYGLALSLRNQGRHEESDAILWRVVESIEATHGPDHVELIGPLDAIAEIAHRQGEYEEAIRTRNRALAIAASSDFADAVIVATARAGLGSDLSELGRWDDAAVELERALTVLATARGTARGAADAVRILLARARLGQGRTADAIEMLETARAEADDAQREEIAELLVEARRRADR